MVWFAFYHRSSDHSNPPKANWNLVQSEEQSTSLHSRQPIIIAHYLTNPTFNRYAALEHHSKIGIQCRPHEKFIEIHPKNLKSSSLACQFSIDIEKKGAVKDTTHSQIAKILKPTVPKVAHSWTPIVATLTPNPKNASWHKKKLINRMKPTSLPWSNSWRTWQGWSERCRVLISKIFQEWVPVLILAESVPSPTETFLRHFYRISTLEQNSSKKTFCGVLFTIFWFGLDEAISRSITLHLEYKLSCQGIDFRKTLINRFKIMKRYEDDQIDSKGKLMRYNCNARLFPQLGFSLYR